LPRLIAGRKSEKNRVSFALVKVIGQNQRIVDRVAVVDELMVVRGMGGGREHL
jgi:hypothetical protein